MSSRVPIFFALALVGALICVDAARAAAGESQAEVAQEQARQRAVEEQQTRERVAQLAAMEAQQRERNSLEARNSKDLEELQTARAAVWATVLRTNQATYQALLKQAAQSPSHTAPCTICNGRGSVDFCVACEGSRKCFRCNGTGKVFGEACPTCRGNGKCYLCFGTGRMPCLFCDDGDVYLAGTPPPQVMPVPGAPLVQAVPRRNIAMGHDSFPSQPAPTTLVQPSEESAMPPRADTPPQANSNLGLVLALALCIILAMRVLLPRIAEFLNQRFDPWAPRSKTVTESAEQLREDEAFARFTARFGTGAPEPRGGAEGVRSTESSEDVQLPGPPGAAANPLRDFLAAAPENLERLRALLQDIVRAPNDAMQRTLVLRLRGELQRLAGLADVREVLPVWQLTYALECLAWHLSEKTERVTASTLRTIAAGLDIVEKLCQAGVRSDLCGNPPIRLLAVDDELFSRRAIALALKQGVAQPDLAESAAEALALAEKQPYDVIFLDVEMPGMDGYELCKRIRATPTNATTPVVFVTLHSKFDERAKSIMAGGSDLIAKPFLLFELTVKALTVALARRLEQPRPQQTAGESADPASQAVSVAATPVTPAPVCS